MISIVQSLDNRELAIGIWLILFLLLALLQARVRKGLRGVIVAVTARPVVAVFLVMIAYYALVTIALWWANAWTFKQIKVSLLWILFSGLPSLAEVFRIREDPKRLKHVAMEILKLVVLLEFFANLFKLPLLAELMLFPFMVVLGISIAASETGNKHAHLRRVLLAVSALIVLALLLFSTYKLVTDGRSVLNVDTLRDFLLPIAYGVTSLPLLWFLATYSAYEEVFIRLQFVVQDKTLHGFIRRRLITSFQFDFRSVSRWLRSAWTTTIESRADVLQSIQAIKSSKRAA